jgi:hypothetical protein
VPRNRTARFARECVEIFECLIEQGFETSLNFTGDLVSHNASDLVCSNGLFGSGAAPLKPPGSQGQGDGVEM